MGRPRGRKRPRARDDDASWEEETALFPVGALVEVRSDDQGFDGSFYEATVEGYHPDGCGYVVAYDTLIRGEDGISPYREHVAAAAVRPRPPPGGATRQPRREFAVHEMVEAFHNEGWWAGVVCRVTPPAVEAEAEPGGERPRPVYTVCFPTSRDVLEFDEARLRPRLVFLGERWVLAAEAENRRPIFRVGSQVEVSRSPKTFGEYWSPATVLKVIDAATFLVQYEDVREDGEVVTEILDAQYIRPGRNISHMDSKYRFSLSSFVEVFHEGSWWPGVILEILDDKSMKKYVVKIKNHETDMEDVECVDMLTVEHTQLRPQYDWYDRKWVRCLTEKQFNRGPSSTFVKRQISSTVQSSNDIYNIAALASCIDSDEIRDESVSSIKEMKNNADVVLEAVCPDLSICNENVQIKQMPSSYPEEMVQQQNSVLVATSPPPLPSQLSVLSGFSHLKHDPKLFLSNQLRLSCPQMISMPSVPQIGQLQVSLFGAFGQIRPLPQGPVLGIQSLKPDFASIGGSQKAFTVQEKQPTDEGFYLRVNPQQEISAGSLVRTALYRKRKESICSETPEGLGENPEIVPTKKRRIDKNAEKTSQDISSSEEETKSKNDYNKDLPDDATHHSGILSEIDTVASIASTPLNDYKGSQERSVSLRESSVVDEIIPSGIPIGIDELHQSGYIGALRLGASKVSILSEHAVHYVITLDKPCEANVLPSDSLTCQHRNKATEVENSEISMEQEAVEEFCKQVLFVADDANVDMLPSTECCEVTRNDHQLHKDNIADMVQLNMSCAVPTDNVSTMAVSMSSDVMPNLLTSSENCEANKKVDTVAVDRQGNIMELPSIMPETQHISADGPISAASLPALKSSISIKQGLTKKSAADEHGVPDPDHSSPMVECAAECSQSTDKSALTQLSSADPGNSTELEYGIRLIEPKHAEGTPMSKYVPSRTQDSCQSLQISLDAHKSILADRPSESLPVENLPFMKTSPMWAQIEAMEIFSKMPQRPNFHQFHQHVPEVREGMALGLMLSFANLGESVKQLNVQDDNSLFEEKMKGLSSLEAEGFDVTHLRSHLETLLHIKNGRTELQDAIKKLEEKIAHEETVDWQLGMQIGMLNSTIRQLHLHAYFLRGITQSAVSEKIDRSIEISRLKAESCELKHLEELFTRSVAAPW